MRILSRSLLCATIALLSTAASAEVVGPGGSHCSGNYYIGSVKSIVSNVTGTNYTVHPTYAGCASGLQAIQNMVYSYNGFILQVTPCHFVLCAGNAEEIDPGPMSPARVQAGHQAEQELRDRYRIDAFERELERAWAETSDGGH